MYYPKSQIKTGLYTKGQEFMNSETLKEYKGDYWGASDGKFFSGKNPNDEMVFNIIPFISDTTIDSKGETFRIQKEEIPSHNILNIGYKNAKPKIMTEPKYPLSSFPTPTEEDYTFGTIERYFLKKTNSYKFLEIPQLEFELYVNKDPSVPYPLYFPFSMVWVISGIKEDVYKINLNTTTRTENSLKIYGFKQYFRGNFNQLYKE